MEYNIKSLAYYLPQFHPIPENDRWWGKGFTEWTNVTKARPLFKGHWQPRLPGELGFYDLRVPEAREAQALLAQKYGVHGFCYWHYWFGGKRIIERPFNEVVESGKPDFPFCVAWANQTWSGTWHGLSSSKTLMEQTYPGIADYEAHFYSLRNAFHDKRYIEVNGKKLVFVFRPMDIPDPKVFIDAWQNLAIKEGFKGIHFVGMHMPATWEPKSAGYDAMVQNWLSRDKFRKVSLLEKLQRRNPLSNKPLINRKKEGVPNIVSYNKYVEHYPEHILKNDEYPLIYADWDNTPRAGKDGWIFEGASPELFKELCLKAFEATLNKPSEERIVVLKSWNEWAEGNYLEPDQQYGAAYLENFKAALDQFENKIKS